VTSSTASRVFVDTNVFACQFDAAAGPKQVRAREIVVGADATICISTQVLAELHSFLTRQLGASRAAAAAVLDALILEAAVEGGCGELWTEDLDDGSTLRGIRIVNPFA